MKRVYFSQHDKNKILNIDFSNCKPEEALQVIDTVRKSILSEPENSVLTLTDLNNIRADEKVIKALKNLLIHNKSYVKKGALINIGKEHKNSYEEAMKTSGRHLVIFDSRDNAVDWLLDRRIFRRYLDPITLEFSVLGGDVKGNAIAKDISLGGICIFSDKKVDRPSILNMKINMFENDSPVEIEGIVSWGGNFNLHKDKPFLIGLQFQKISVQAHQKLFQYILARSKEQIV